MKISKNYLLEATNTGDVFQKPIEQEKNDLKNLVNKSNNTSNDVNSAILSDNLENVKNAVKKGGKITDQSFDYAILREKPIPEIIEYVTRSLPVKDSQILVKGLKTKKEELKKLILELPKDKEIVIINESPDMIEDSIEGLKIIEKIYK